jgi:hypothetical protein
MEQEAGIEPTRAVEPCSITELLKQMGWLTGNAPAWTLSQSVALLLCYSQMAPLRGNDPRCTL